MARHMHIPLVHDRLWLNLSAGRGYVTIAVQHRVADPPAIPQTCHHSLLLSTTHGVVTSKELS